MNLWEPMQWNELTATVARGPAAFPIDSLSVYLYDPRIARMPVAPDAARQMGCKVYHLAQDPFKFQDAVVVGARDGYYGQCQFQIDLSTPQYLKMDHNSLKGSVSANSIRQPATWCSRKTATCSASWPTAPTALSCVAAKLRPRSALAQTCRTKTSPAHCPRSTPRAPGLPFKLQ